MTTTRVSTAADGTQGNGLSFTNSTGVSQISADGRYVVFTSEASNLVSGDTNNAQDVFVKDLSNGTITRVSVASDGTPTSNGGDSASPSISADGRYVAFASTASNLVSGDTNNIADIFVKDLATGTIARVNTASDGTQASGISNNPSISADGRYVAFASNASNLVSGDTNNLQDVFVKDLSTGVIARVNTASDGTQASGGNSNGVSISTDGRYVAFASTARNLVSGDTNNAPDVFVKDLSTGTITRVNTASDGTQASGGNSGNPSISADGRYVAFASTASNLVSGDTNNVQDIFVKDLSTGTITRVNTASDGTPTSSGNSGNPSISADGRYVAFASTASNLVSGDTNNALDVFVKDLTTGTITRVSVASDGTPTSSGSSNTPSISGDGSRVVFQSTATNLVANDTNSSQDVFAAHAVCFAAGTRIRTVRGEVAVEDLMVGDLAVTASGAHRPIRWTGHRTVLCQGRPDLMPVRIAAHAFADDRPARDLRVSPAHALCLDLVGEVLVPAIHLVNGTTLAQEPLERVTYWHVELDSHDILLAEGLPAESYLDRGNRAFFAEAQTVDLALGPDIPADRTAAAFCRPLHEAGPLVEFARARLRERAEASGWTLVDVPMTDLHLVADGQMIRPDIVDLTARFVLSAEAREVRLVSSSSVPAHVEAESGDFRRLGVLLGALAIDDGLTGARTIALDDARLAEGFHAVESSDDAIWRWTDGGAVLPPSLWEGCRGTIFLRVRLNRTALRRWVRPQASSGGTGDDRQIA